MSFDLVKIKIFNQPVLQFLCFFSFVITKKFYSADLTSVAKTDLRRTELQFY